MIEIRGKDTTLFRDIHSYTQGVGYSHRLEYHALVKSRLYPIMDQLKNAGYSCTIDQLGVAPKWSLVAVSAGPQDGSTEVPVDRWSWRKELVQRSIWSKPEVAKALKDRTDAATIRQTIESGVQSGRSWTAITGDLPNDPDIPIPTLLKVYKELVGGGESYELEYLVLTRTRATRIGYPNRITLTATSTIYTTDDLIDEFDIPSDVAAILPDSADQAEVDSQSTWGWRQRDESGDREGFVRFAEQTSWVFASWSTFLYTPA